MKHAIGGRGPVSVRARHFFLKCRSPIRRVDSGAFRPKIRAYAYGPPLEICLFVKNLHSTQRVLVIGCHGGIGRAVVSLLRQRTFRDLVGGRSAEILFVDREPAIGRHDLGGGVLLPPTTIRSADDLARLVRDHRVAQVIDLSSLDTVECATACDALGADYLCTSVEEWPGTPPLTTLQSIERVLPPQRPVLVRSGQLIGSGANPGIVNALALVGLREFAARAGVAPTPEALHLQSILVTEEDSTVDAGGHRPGTFAMTWSPGHCLEELFEPSAFVGSYGGVKPLDHEPTGLTYRARCGHFEIEGFAVPHEELATLARRFPTVEEIGFVYRLPAAARAALAAHPDRRRPESWPTRRLWPPWATKLTGHDRVGVLFVSRRFGELWIGFDTDVRTSLRVGVNATQLQVAAGVLAGWQQLGQRRGMHFVEDLDCHQYIAAVGRVLGRPVVTYAPNAAAISLRERRVRRADAQAPAWVATRVS